MNKGLKWRLMSAIVFAASCAYLAGDPSTPSHASSNSARAVVASGEMKILTKAPTDDQLAGRTRRLWRRAYRRTV